MTSYRIRYYLILFTCLIIIVNTIRSLGDYYRAENRLKTTRERLDKAKADRQRLLREKRKVESNEFVEEEARNRLGMARPGERVIILPEDFQTPMPESPKDTTPNWVKWWRLFF